MTTPAEQMAINAAQSQQSSFFIDNMGIISVKSYGAKGDGVTDDTKAVSDAINKATSVGLKSLFFPHGVNGTYKVDPELGELLKEFYLWGDNAIFAGIALTINQIGDWANSTEYNSQTDLTIYVDGTNGNDGSSGYSPQTAKKTIQAAINSLPTVFIGNVTIDVAAGTYKESLMITKQMSARQIVIKGKKDLSNNPTVIIDSEGTRSYGIYAEYYKRLLVKDIKVQNCTDFGVEAAFYSELATDNIVVSNCNVYGIKIWDKSYGRISNSKINNCNSASIVVYGNSIYTITSCILDTGTNDGVYVANASNGHIDGCTIQNFSNYGIHVVDSSYAQVGTVSPALQTVVNKCGGGLYVTSNSVAYDENISYGTSVDANTSFDSREDTGGIITSKSNALTSNPHPNTYSKKSYVWFYYNDVAANLSNTIMKICTDNTINFYLIPKGGYVTDIGIYSNGARTAGTLTAQVYYGGTAVSGCSATIDGSATTQKFVAFDSGTKSFGAGALQIKITSSSDWAPTTADIQVVVGIMI